MTYRILSFCLSAVAFLSSAAVLYSLQMMGFPDGHLTALDRAAIPLMRVTLVGGGLFGLGFLVLGWMAPKGGRKAFWGALAGFAILVAVVLVVYANMSLHLENGAGG